MSRSALLASLGGALLLAIGVQGGVNVSQDIHQATTGLQRGMVAAQLAYTLISPVPILARWRRSAWTRPSLLIWGLLLTLAASLAPAAWADSPLSTCLGAGLLTAAIALTVVWLVSRGLSGSVESPQP